MPKPENSPSAVIVSGGKQYRVALGDRILVDRIAAEPGSSVKLDRVLLFSDGTDVKVGNPAVEGLDVDARVLAHRRGPRIESIRYKSKKRVRVHRGGRSHLTALEIVAVGGVALPSVEEAEEEPKARTRRGRAKAAPKKKAEARAAALEGTPEAVEKEPAEEEEKKPSRRHSRKESE